MDQGVINKGLKSAKIVFFGQKNLAFFSRKRCGIGGASPGAQLLAGGVPMAAEAAVPTT